MSNLATEFAGRRRKCGRVLCCLLVALLQLSAVSVLVADQEEEEPPRKACILIWLADGPPSAEMWDPKEGRRFHPIETAGGVRIGSPMPRTAKVMDRLSIIRSMSTREGDHGRSESAMLTSYPPNAHFQYPSFGSIVSNELTRMRENLELPGFISIGGPCGTAGYLGREHAPFVVDYEGKSVSLLGAIAPEDLKRRQPLLDLIDSDFELDRNRLLKNERTTNQRLRRMIASEQMAAFHLHDEDPKVLREFGENEFGRGLVLARRLVQQGVPFVSVRFPFSWDIRERYFETLSECHFPMLDQGLSALVEDLTGRHLLDDVVLVVTGPFGRNSSYRKGRPSPRSWSLLIGGGGLVGGAAVGQTDKTGTKIESRAYQPGDVWATVAFALGIPHEIEYVTPNGRPVSIVNHGSPIKQLVAPIRAPKKE